MILRPFSEHSFPCLKPELILAPPDPAGPPINTRQWLSLAHSKLAALLPPGRPALITEQLVNSDGSPADVFAHFGIDRQRLPKLRGNWDGLAHTAQVSGDNKNQDATTPPWEGFEDVSIPGAGGVEICGRLGRVRKGTESAKADCLVILPGLLGDNNVLRTRDLGKALMAHGYHVLALELRGHGDTYRAQPEVRYTFGVQETLDLLAVSRWLEQQPCVQETGLVGFCWGGNHALLASWIDGATPDHPGIMKDVAPYYREIGGQRHYTRGVMAFSSVLRYEKLMTELDRPWSRFEHPAFAGLQNSVKTRMTHRNYPNPSTSLRKIIEDDLCSASMSYPGFVEDATRFVCLMEPPGSPGFNKLATARTPTLIVHAANDPLAPAQDVADLISWTTNPMVAAIILPGGGHIGFAAYATAFYFSLILSFFSRVRK
ncbi:MAG: alpha/beta fold hydrolase [Planctomycetia bacterium]|nr:alpha/beta fold hydrolase [Planctomycetia bacterium]MCC7315217.1 alpha/beta fold hydrolase [Planctomycetota bacterium]